MSASDTIAKNMIETGNFNESIYSEGNLRAAVYLIRDSGRESRSAESPGLFLGRAQRHRQDDILDS